MKTLLLTAALLLSTDAMSEEPPTKLEYCTGMSELAEAAMTARQTNVPLHKLMSMQEINTNPIAVAMVKMAYNEPVMHSDKNKQITIYQFGSQVMLMCLDSVEI